MNTEALPGREHDVIVVGAGAGGCVVASRLAATGLDVLLLEAGPADDNPAIINPARAFELPGTDIDWRYMTVEQSACENRTIACSAGRVIGGSSSINNTIWARGSRSDFDGWAAQGNAGWGWEDVLPLFRRIEDFDAGPSADHGSGGPLPIMSQYPVHPMMTAFIEAAQSAGLPYNLDYNDGTLDGVTLLQFNARGGERFSAARAYLRTSRTVGHLSVLTDTVVHRLLMNGERCEGVEALSSGVPHRYHARHEVVLTAGALSTPRLLLLSGIGAGDDLRALGIPVIADLPGVGRNLHDQALALLVHEAARAIPPGQDGHTQYQAGAFLRSDADLAQPDIEYMAVHLPYLPGGGPSEGFTLLTILAQPESRGQLRLRSADPQVPSAIDPAYLTDERDVDALVSALVRGREILATEPLAAWLGSELLPGADLTSPAALQSHVRQIASSFYHPVGSCRMGVDDLSVVDPTLSVHGVSGLRVADASVMPRTTSANTHAPTIMFAERASDLIAKSLGTRPAVAVSTG